MNIKQYLELTQDGVLIYSIFKLKENDKNLLLHSNKMKIFNEIKVEQKITDEQLLIMQKFLKDNIDLIMDVFPNLKKVNNINEINLIFPNVISKLENQKMDINIQENEALNYNSLKVLFNDNVKKFKDFHKEYFLTNTEEKFISINGIRKSFKKSNYSRPYNSIVTLEWLNNYTSAYWVNNFSKVVQGSNLKMKKIYAKGSVIKNNLNLINKFDTNEQAEILIDWGMKKCWIEAKSINGSKRFEIDRGINKIIDEIIEQLNVSEELNILMIKKYLLNIMDLENNVHNDNINILRIMDDNRNISEFSAREMKKIIQDSIMKALNSLYEHLYYKYKIQYVKKSNKYHFGAISEIQNLNNYLRTVPENIEMNNFVVENRYENKILGTFTKDIYSSCILAEIEKVKIEKITKIKKDLKERSEMEQDISFYGLTNNNSQPRASLFKNNQNIIKEKL